MNRLLFSIFNGDIGSAKVRPVADINNRIQSPRESGNFTGGPRENERTSFGQGVKLDREGSLRRTPVSLDMRGASPSRDEHGHGQVG